MIHDSAIHGLPVTLRMLSIKSNKSANKSEILFPGCYAVPLVYIYNKSDWLRMRNDYSAHAPKIGPSQTPPRGRDHGADQKDRGLWGQEYLQQAQESCTREHQ